MIYRRKLIQYQDALPKEYPDEFSVLSSSESLHESRIPRTVTFQVTDKCNLACSYCYQINKGTRKMSFETAKKFVDLVLRGDNEYINTEISGGVIFEFIGGEPFLEIELIHQICDYIEEQMILQHHPWIYRHIYSICSNGTLYFDQSVQAFLLKYKDILSFSVTIDGNKSLHDSCRVFPDGRGSYELAVAAANDWMSKGFYMGSKITIAPGNLSYLYDAIIHMIDLGYEEINANCVYEKGWELHHATEFYYQLKRVADYFYENKLEYSHYLSLFEEDFFKPKRSDDINNWCGGTGLMLSCDPDGYLYPCIRYMESSLGDTRKPIRIGHVDTGLAKTCEEKECVNCLNSVDRKTQSTEECFNCPIAEGCSWCSAYNYQEFGTVNHRATYICDMHKARSLANGYFWNRFYKREKLKKRFTLNLPREEAIKIIPEEEFDMLIQLSN